jgi:hypothetical protein
VIVVVGGASKVHLESRGKSWEEDEDEYEEGKKKLNDAYLMSTLSN